MSFKSKIVKSVLFATVTSVTTAYAFMSHAPASYTQEKVAYQIKRVDFTHHTAVISIRDNQQLIHVSFTNQFKDNHQVIECIDEAYVTDQFGNIDKNYVLDREDLTQVVSVLEAV